MKRSWIGVGFLLVLLIAGILVTKTMETIHEIVEADLEQAAVFALSEDWDQARASFYRAKGEWEKWEHFRSCFADHEPVEEVDSGFALLEVYGSARENAAFAAECRRLARQTSAVGEAHGLYWWNIF